MSAIHGILVQLPLPAHIRVSSVLERISVEKDVDGFHLYNMGGLVTGNTVFSPCTPYGVQKILEHENIPVEGRNVVVVGASNIVGKPTALMLMQQDATVVICHKKTRDLGNFTLLADILVVAAGVPNLIVPQIVKTGAVVIDVGIQSPAGRAHRRRRGLRRREGKGVLHHAGAGRRRSDDRDDAPPQHDSFGGTRRERDDLFVPRARSLNHAIIATRRNKYAAICEPMPLATNTIRSFASSLRSQSNAPPSMKGMTSPGWRADFEHEAQTVVIAVLQARDGHRNLCDRLGHSLSQVHARRVSRAAAGCDRESDNRFSPADPAQRCECGCARAARR